MRISPHLTFDGHCKAAFLVYHRIFGGDLRTMLTYGESPMASQVDPQWHDRIAHATLSLGDVELTGADVPSRDYGRPQGFFVTLTLDNPARAESIFHALAEDGDVRLPFRQTFWSPGFGVVIDRFGVPWELNSTHEPLISHANGNALDSNRSMPEAVVIPELGYDDVSEAVSWLCSTFGFKKRLLIGNHRAQLSIPNGGALIVTQRAPAQVTQTERLSCHAIMVRVHDVDAHCQHAAQQSAKILSAPKDYPYGERQYSVEDLAGHMWTFSQSIADVDPASWGGKLVEG